VKPLRNRKGIVGIEAAIVLIAFVVIAAALSYVVINMGFFATQKTKETIAEGISESSAALQLDGTVTAKTGGASEEIEVLPGSPEIIDTGDGVETFFIGALDHHPVVPDTAIPPTTLAITDALSTTPETFTDVAGDGVLIGSLGGSGTIDYATGEYILSFNTAPDDTVDITASYTYMTMPNSVEYIVFPVKLSVGKAEVDLGTDSVVVSVYLPSSTLLDVYGGCKSDTEKDLETALGEVAVDSAEFRIYNDDGDTVLESKEKAFLVVHLDSSHYLAEYEIVKIEVKTGRGAALTVVRTAPGGMSAESYVDLG